MHGYNFRFGHSSPIVFHPPVLTILSSLILGGLVFFLFWLFMPLESGEGYCVLAVDEAVPDREIGDRLKASGFHSFYSESEALVFYDDFGEPKGFFLDELSGKMESFDPRNDGYDERLRSFFVQDETRRFFIPLGKGGRSWQIERVMRNIMGPVPYTLDILIRGRNVVIWFLFQSIAAAFALFVSRERLLLLPVIPVILSFAWGALPGLILSCTLIGLWELLREPLRELFAHNPYGSVKYRLKSYKTSIAWAGLLAVFYVFFTVTGAVPGIPAMAGLFSCIAIQALYFIEAKKAKEKRRSFTPVIMLSVDRKPRVFCIAMAAFASVTLLAFVLVMLAPGLFFHKNDKTNNYLSNLPAVSDYEEHMAFQAAFSFRPLSTGYGEYFQYFLGEDGLIAGIFESDMINQWEIPVFPLEKLTEFLIEYTDRPGTNPLPNHKDWISMGLIILACAPFRQRAKSTGKINKHSLEKYPRVAA
jgi:hypothetical protein